MLKFSKLHTARWSDILSFEDLLADVRQYNHRDKPNFGSIFVIVYENDKVMWEGEVTSHKQLQHLETNCRLQQRADQAEKMLLELCLNFRFWVFVVLAAVVVLVIWALVETRMQQITGIRLTPRRTTNLLQGQTSGYWFSEYFVDPPTYICSLRWQPEHRCDATSQTGFGEALWNDPPCEFQTIVALGDEIICQVKVGRRSRFAIKRVKDILNGFEGSLALEGGPSAMDAATLDISIAFSWSPSPFEMIWKFIISYMCALTGTSSVAGIAAVLFTMFRGSFNPQRRRHSRVTLSQDE